MAKNLTPPLLDDRQFNLFGASPKRDVRQRTAADSGRRFVTGDRNLISLCGTKLEEHLKQAGQKAPFVVSKLLDQQDWRVFESRYAATGRAPYSPRLMMGLILYGVMRGVHSLRELERMANLDLGCMWVAAGIRPDHSNICRFITLHHDSLTQDFFESLTRSILKASGSSSSCVAGDGTVIEAACSHYKLLKEEALKAQLEQARQEEIRLVQAKTPIDPTLKAKLATLEEALETFEQRKAARVSHGKDPASLRISVQEPEAMLQPSKRGRGVCPSYKPSALANADRIVTAFAVDASSENKVISAMLDQSERVGGAPVQELLLDAGYFDNSVIEETLARDISMLCPEGKTPERPKASELFHKSAFTFDEQAQTYRCPAGQIMLKIESCSGQGKTRKYDLYGGADCDNCTMRTNCTAGKNGRTIKRYPEDERRDALRFVMQQPSAREVFRKRKAMIEPVFSHLRGQQALHRFRRKGLHAVTREFALHAMAYNLSRAVALLGAMLIAFLALLTATKNRNKTKLPHLVRNFITLQITTLFLPFADKNRVQMRC